MRQYKKVKIVLAQGENKEIAIIIMYRFSLSENDFPFFSEEDSLATGQFINVWGYNASPLTDVAMCGIPYHPLLVTPQKAVPLPSCFLFCRPVSSPQWNLCLICYWKWSYFIILEIKTYKICSSRWNVMILGTTVPGHILLSCWMSLSKNIRFLFPDKRLYGYASESGVRFPQNVTDQIIQIKMPLLITLRTREEKPSSLIFMVM